MSSCIAIPITDIRPNNREDLYNLLKDIEAGDEKLTTFCLFDSCGWNFVQDFKEIFPWIQVVWNKGKAFNFTKNANLGLHLAYENNFDGCWLINQDCRLHLLNNKLSELEGKGLTSPQSVDHFPIKYLGDYSRRSIIGHFPFYCVHIPRAVIEKIGFLDETMIKTHSDDDACCRALLAGFSVEIVNYNIHHKGTHIDSTNLEWESASGCYNARDLAISSLQYKHKWGFGNHPNDDIIPLVLEQYVWDDKFKVS